MLKRAIQTIFLILASLLVHSVASAQSPTTSFSYADKNEAIYLAKAGDAEALYKLGVSHLYGISSTQNSKVAERFFFYSAEKGHAEAKLYLAEVKKTRLAAEAASSPKRAVKSKSFQRETAATTNIANHAQKNQRDSEKQIAERKKRAEDKKAARKKKRAEERKAARKKKQDQKKKAARKASSLKMPATQKSAAQKRAASKKTKSSSASETKATLVDQE